MQKLQELEMLVKYLLCTLRFKSLFLAPSVICMYGNSDNGLNDFRFEKDSASQTPTN